MPIVDYLIAETGTSIARAILTKMGLIENVREDELALKISEQIEKKIFDAKREYEEALKDLSSPLERQRERILSNLTQLQTSVILYVSNQSLLIKLFPILLNQTVETYQAQTVQDLKLIELGLEQVKATVKQYQNLATRRVIARWLAVIVSIAAVVGLGCLIFWGLFPNGPSVNTVLPVINIPLPILIWSAIGSFTAILYRFNNSGDIELQDPLRWLFTRPLTGIVMGIIAYFVISVGFQSTGAKIFSVAGAPEILWLVAFISGFSDRFADGLLKSLVGRFGGKAEAELVTLDNISASANLSSLVESLPVLKDWLGKSNRTIQENAKQNVGATDQAAREALIIIDNTKEEETKISSLNSISSVENGVASKED